LTAHFSSLLIDSVRCVALDVAKYAHRKDCTALLESATASCT